MQRVWWIVSLGLLVCFWTWFLNQVFSRYSQSGFGKWSSLFYGAVLVLIFLGLEKSISFLDLPSLQQVLGFENGLFALGYLSVFLVSFPLLFWVWSASRIWVQLVVGILSLFLLLGLGELEFVISGVLYYLLFAYAEELFKFSLAHIRTVRARFWSVSQLLLFSLLIALGFGIAELVLALVFSIWQGQVLSPALLLGRGLLASWIHMLSTGMIALFLLKKKGLPQVVVFFLALGAGFFFHALYNLALYFQQWWFAILLGIWGFWMITYLLYHLDELYSPPT